MSRESAGRARVLERLPHRYPFRMVDRVTACEPGTRIEGIKHVGSGDRSDLGLTPLLLCESLAQLSKALEIVEDPEARAISFLASLQVDFLVHDSLTEDVSLSATRVKSFNSMTSYRIEATSGGSVLLKGVLTRRIFAE